MTELIKIFKQINIFFFLILIIILNSCIRTETIITNNTAYYHEINLPVEDSANTKICIANSGKIAIDLIFQVNDKFWFSENQLKSSILNLKSDSIKNINKKISKAWLFTFLNSFHLMPLELSSNEMNNPLIFFNSAGGGLCSDRAYILTQLWRSFGYKSRVMYLGNHVVAEVWENNKWNMFDPDNGVYFIDSLNNIASVDEIAQKPMIMVIDSNSISRSFQLLNIIYNKKYYIDLFASTYNNFPDSDTGKIVWENTYLSLPPESRFELPVKNPNIEDDMPFCFGRITIPHCYAGFISIPFVIHHIEGNGMLINNERYILPGQNDNPYPSGNYYVSCDSLKIYTYINPLLIKLYKTNKIKIVSNSSMNPIVSLTKNETYIPDYYSYKIDKLILRHKDQYLSFFKKWPGDVDTLNICTLQEFKEQVIFVYKNTFNTSMVPDSINTKIDSFANFIDSVYPGMDFSQSIFNNIRVFRTTSVAIIELNPDHLMKMIKYNLSDIKRKNFK